MGDDHEEHWYSDCSGKKKALLIGINYKGTDSPLDGCHSDVERMKKFIVSRYSFKEEDIKVLKDDLWLTKEFQPTKANILAAMDWLVSGVQPNDSLFFHYSGHGGQVEDTSGDEADYQDECIYPIDSVALTGASAEGSEARTANIIIDDLLYTTLVRPLPTGARLTAIFDSCHSGSVLDLPFAYAAGSGRVKHQGLEGMHLNVEGLAERPKLYRGHDEHSEKVRKAEEGVFKVKGMMADAKEIISGSGRKIFQEKDTKGAISDLGKLLEVKQHIRGVEEMRKVSETWADVILISGCKDKQVSEDVVQEGTPTGALSWALISVLEAAEKPTYLDLLSQIRDKLKKNHYAQLPQLSTGHHVNIEEALFFA